jgi:hypothetical protein
MKLPKTAISLILLLPLIVKAQNIVTGDTLSSGIVYHNIKDSVLPILTQGVRTADFDLEGDNVNDIRFSITQNYSPGHTYVGEQLLSLDSLEFVVLASSPAYLDSFSMSRNINNNLNWHYTTNALSLFEYSNVGGTTTIYGVFLNQTRYVGFRKIAATDTIYGWILVEASFNNGLRIMSWAYENKGLNIGINELQKVNTVTLYPNPSNNKIWIPEGDKTAFVAYWLYNATGTVIKQGRIPDDKSIDISGLERGLYYLRLASSKGFSKGQFVKE